MPTDGPAHLQIFPINRQGFIHQAPLKKGWIEAGRGLGHATKAIQGPEEVDSGRAGTGEIIGNTIEFGNQAGGFMGIQFQYGNGKAHGGGNTDGGGATDLEGFDGGPRFLRRVEVEVTDLARKQGLIDDAGMARDGRAGFFGNPFDRFYHDSLGVGGHWKRITIAHPNKTGIRKSCF